MHAIQADNACWQVCCTGSGRRLSHAGCAAGPLASCHQRSGPWPPADGAEDAGAAHARAAAAEPSAAAAVCWANVAVGLVGLTLKLLLATPPRSQRCRAGLQRKSGPMLQLPGVPPTTPWRLRNRPPPTPRRCTKLLLRWRQLEPSRASGAACRADASHSGLVQFSACTMNSCPCPALRMTAHICDWTTCSDAVANVQSEVVEM